MQNKNIKTFIHKIFMAVCLTMLMGGGSYAESNLRDIKVIGNQRIESSTIITNSDLRVGQAIDQNQLDEAVAKLFDTGYFSDVKVTMEGNAAVITVEENPIVNRIYFEGNKQFDDKTLAKQIRLQPRQIYTIAKLKQDTATIHEMLRIKGHFGARVTPKIVKQDQNRVDVVFEFVEGNATKIAKLLFVGNEHMKSDALKRVVNTKESKWWRFFSSDDNYDPSRLALDQELLRRHYLENGYVDFSVKSAVAELTPDQKEFYITYTLSEGERYKYGKIDVDIQVAKIDAEALRQEIVAVTDNWYSSTDLDKSIQGMTEYLGSHGYAFVDIRPEIQQNEEKHTIDIVFQVLEGPKTYIDRIVVTGNVRTNEDVIRRELLVYEGDAYNTYNIKRSKQRITNLGFFKDVKVTEKPGESSDKVDLVVEVDEEESTGELWVAGGYSTAEGILGNVGIKENNLMGRGQSVHLQTTVSAKRQQIDLGFMEPHFLNRNISAGFDIFKLNSKQHFNGSFESKSIGVNLKLGYDLTEYLNQSWIYGIHLDKIGDIKGNASQFIKNQAGRVTSSSLTHKLNYDRRDDRFDPTSGYYLGMSNEFAGLGGNVKFLKNELNGGYYYSVMPDWVVSFTGSGGVMNGLNGKVVRIADRFNMGGDGSLRGFKESGAETRDKKTGDSLGGLKYYLATVELQVPLDPFGIPKDFGIKSHVFTDVGSAFDSKFNKSLVFDTPSPRVSVGFGISWRSPLGPLRIDFAKHLKTRHYDKHKTVHFGFFTGK